MKWGNLAKLVEKVGRGLDRQGFLLVNDAGRVMSVQTGIHRSNCMDCLDRTNVVQSVFARRMLLRQLRSFRIISAEELDVCLAKTKSSLRNSFWSKKRLVSAGGAEVVNWDASADGEPSSTSSLVRSGSSSSSSSSSTSYVLKMPYEKLEKAFRILWSENADEMSLLYAGTPALKGDFTRTGKRTTTGLFMDGLHSAVRYYINNFLDADRQEAIDIILGKSA